MKVFLSTFVFMVTLLIFGLVGVFCWGYVQWTGPGPLAETRTVLIERGSGVSGIATELHQEHIIENPLVFKVAARLSGQQGQLKAGEYEFQPKDSMEAVMAKIASGDVVDRKISVPEGLTSWQVVQIINKTENLTGEISSIPAEGSLLPETYHYTKDRDRNAVVTEMQAAMKKTMDELWPARAEGLPFSTPEEALAMASIVEKETGVASERARIAGVFINRLRQNMPLQTDPTVIYAITKGEMKGEGMGPLGRRLLRKDLLETDSPYNTYKYPGLPPGPIANPGRAAIEATLHPEEHHYIYFVANGGGGHIFARTLAEHQTNVANWRKVRKELEN